MDSLVIFSAIVQNSGLSILGLIFKIILRTVVDCIKFSLLLLLYYYCTFLMFYLGNRWTFPQENVSKPKGKTVRIKESALRICLYNEDEAIESPYKTIEVKTYGTNRESFQLSDKIWRLKEK